MVKKLIVFTLVFIILITSFSMGVSGIKIWPGKHHVTINKWYTDANRVDRPKIQITNTESYPIEIAIRVDNPSVKALTEGYSFVPDLSWIKVIPENLVIPGEGSDFVEIIIEVPEDEQSSHYNESWEAYVVISPPLNSGGGLNIQTELAVKLFIKTPEGEVTSIPYLIILLFLFILTTIIYAFLSNIKKKKSKEVMFYFKKKKDGS